MLIFSKDYSKRCWDMVSRRQNQRSTKTIAGVRFNISSPKQVGKFFLTDIKYRINGKDNNATILNGWKKLNELYDEHELVRGNSGISEIKQTKIHICRRAATNDQYEPEECTVHLTRLEPLREGLQVKP